MATRKVTFTLDAETVSRIDRAAVELYDDQIARLREIAARPPDRTAAEVDRELQAIRDARRRGGRLTDPAAHRSAL